MKKNLKWYTLTICSPRIVRLLKVLNISLDLIGPLIFHEKVRAWLLDEYDLLVDVFPCRNKFGINLYFGVGTGDEKQWSVYTSEESFSTYENALDQGIYCALKLIKEINSGCFLK